MKQGDNDTKHIKHIYNTFGNTQLIENATRTTVITVTLIDHLATTRSINISGKDVIPCRISDHDVIFLVRSMHVPRVKKHPEVLKVLKLQQLEIS